MFYVKSNEKPNSPPIMANHSHLHKVTSPTSQKPNIPVHQSQIPRKQPPGKLHVDGTDVSIASSVVSSFLQAVSAKENGSVNSPVKKENGNSPVKNNSHLFKSQQSLKTSPVLSEPQFNHLGLRKVNSTESGVAGRVKSFTKEVNQSFGKCAEKDETVVLRTKSSPEKFKESIVNNKKDILQRSSSTEEKKWKAKYEEAEKRRKELLTESQKATREKNNLELRLKKLEDEHKQLKNEHQDKTQQLNQLRRVSEQVYQDYDKLNSKYETETTTLHKALEVASKWYKENKKLKRESVALRSTVMTSGHVLDQIKDELDGEEPQGQDELEELRKTVQDLSNQVGQLQSELNRARLQEFEAQEQFINLTQALDEERKSKEKMEQELKELRLMKEKFESVTYIVHDEMKALRTERDRANEAAYRLQAQANQAQKERNVLAHQSSLLMGEISSNETLMKVLLEVEDLKRKLEEETQNHAAEVQGLQEKLEYRESEAQLELLEEKLKLAESELQLALQRAEQAEQSQQMLGMSQSRLNSENVPPPPPPPPPMPSLNVNRPPILKKPDSNREKPTVNGNSIEDMANILGIQRIQKSNNVQGGAIDDIINEIKGGKFTLKATEKQKMKKEEPPPAVQEMLNIIGTLKRRPAHSRRAPADVQL